MKTLTNHLILYDAECPMCNMYTRAFVKTGLLDTNGRAAYQQTPPEVCPLIDRQRAMDEIALIDTRTGEVNYGVKSLFKIFANAMPVFKPLFGFKPFIWLMSKVYAFISYNRRVIIPAPMVADAAMQPSFKIQYRIAYLTFTALVCGFILTAYAHLLNPIVPLGGSYREYFICGGQMIFQWIIISMFAGNKLWSYLGNMMTISFAGSLLLLPAFAVHHTGVAINPVFYLLYFMGVAGLMFFEHIRRSKLLQLCWGLTISWVGYRLMVLALIFMLN